MDHRASRALLILFTAFAVILVAFAGLTSFEVLRFPPLARFLLISFSIAYGGLALWLWLRSRPGGA